MTNTEAITKLANIMHDDHYAWHPSILTAFGMAVDALKGAEGDWISRHALKEAFVETTILEWEQLKKCYPMLEVVDEVPSAQSDHIADGGKKDDHFRDLTKKMDTISRQAAIDVAMECGKKIPTYAIRMKTLIEQLPSAQSEQLERCPIYDGVCGYPSDQCYDCPRHHGAQQEQRWIPCSERLPEEYGEYLVTKRTIGWNCEEYDSNDIAYFDSDGFHKADKVTAWMPLPEPWEEGEADD